MTYRSVQQVIWPPIGVPCVRRLWIVDTAGRRDELFAGGTAYTRGIVVQMRRELCATNAPSTYLWDAEKRKIVSTIWTSPEDRGRDRIRTVAAMEGW